MAPKLQESRWNLFLFSKHGNCEKISVFFIKRTRKIEKIESRWARQETDHTSLISLFWLPDRLFNNHFRKNIRFALLKDRFEAFWSFFYEVTSVGELWTDKYLSYNFDSNLKWKKRNHWRGLFFESWFYLFCAFQQPICPKRTPLTSAG